jgi:polyketide biosynthesis acyl carrier protein
MTRDEVLQVVLKHIAENVDGIEGTTIDPSKSIADYEASSLDIVEIVSASMRELRLNIPRTELAKLQSIDQLVDLFTKSKNGA